MKILLDECISHRVRHLLEGHEVFSVTFLGWSGLQNGVLLTSAVAKGFDVFLTIDKNIPFQQYISNYDIAVVVLDVQTSSFENIAQLIPTFIERIRLFDKGKAYVI